VPTLFRAKEGTVRKLLMTLIGLSVLTACSVFDGGVKATSKEVSADIDYSTVSFSLYLQRGGLGGSEFEQYKTLSDSLFVECGDISKGRVSSEYQSVLAIDSQELAEVKKRIARYINKYDSISSDQYDAPGMEGGFSDPGKCIVRLRAGERSLEIKTSLDWVERSRDELSRELRHVVELIRGLPSNSLCENKDFYGLKRS
jgi:hypothetical protein